MNIENLLTLVEHGGLAVVLAWLLQQERKERIAYQNIMETRLAKCLDQQEQLLDEEFSPRNK